MKDTFKSFWPLPFFFINTLLYCNNGCLWDQPINSRLEPSFDMELPVDLWFFSLFSQFLFVVIIKVLCTDMKSKQTQFSDYVSQILENPGKSSEINYQIHVK